MNFRIRGLEAEQFSHLFALSEAELAAQGALRKIADGPCPCRVSLTDATPGDEVILVNYEHHAVASPYRMRFAIYVLGSDRGHLAGRGYRTAVRRSAHAMSAHPFRRARMLCGEGGAGVTGTFVCLQAWLSSVRPMSALGQKQTFAAHKSMSALPPKADMCGALAHVRFVP
jgi:hypothetical protein